MFKFASSFERTLSDWNSSPIVDKTNMFLNSTCTVEKCLERTVPPTLNPIISSIPSKYVCKDSEGSKVIEYKNKNYSCKKISRSGSIKQMCKRRKARIACPITCDSCQSKLPSSIPSVLPTISLLPNSQSIPSRVPSMNPSPYPSKSRSPTEGSSKAPSDIFSPLPSVVPSSSPAESPSVSPSISQSPSFEASVLPTVAVTDSKSVANLFIKQEYVKKLSCRKIRKWIKNKDNKGCRYCGDENVKNLCPVTCKRCEQYIWSSAFPTASSVPSFSHSVPPSNQVTISPSPSSVPSSLPSLTYSDIPSMVISNTSSSVPIASPSEVPTSFPSEHNQTEQLSVRLLALEGGTESLKQNKGTEFLTNSKRSTSRHSQKEKHPRALQKLRSSKGDVPRFKSSSYPSFIPSSQPDMAPSSIPSISPSLVPSAIPTNNPTSTPSAIPSLSMAPSSVPSSSPTYVVVIELNQKVSKVTEKKFLTNLSNETDVEMDVETEAFFGDVEEVKIQVVKVDLFY